MIFPFVKSLFLKFCFFFFRERVLNTSGTRLEEAQIGGLQPARLYHFRVVAHNARGAGISSDDFEIETNPEVHVPGPPMNVNVNIKSLSKIESDCFWVETNRIN